MQAVIDALWLPDVALATSAIEHDADRSNQDDAGLLHAWRRGDENAFGQLYRRHRDRLWRFVQRLVEDRAQAEEVAQEVWLAVIAGRNAFAERARFSTWLFAIAHHRAAERLRRAGRRLETNLDDWDEAVLPTNSGADPEAFAEQDEDARRLQHAIARLPLPQREAFLLRNEAGLDIAEIAVVTSCPSETVKTRLRYAYEKLRRALESAA